MKSYLIREIGDPVPWVLLADSAGEAVAKVLQGLQELRGDSYKPGGLVVREVA